ncbi:MAG: type III polyketide synthase [Vulcanimicrobiaceae bacterium]
MGSLPRLLAIASAVPPFELDQEDVAVRVKAQFGSRSATVERLLPVFANTGIERRFSCVPIEWYYKSHDWGDRNNLYIESALTLLESAAKHALDDASLEVGDIDALVVVSTTGIATPSLDARLIERMGFRRTCKRLPIFGLGCAGGALGLARAADVARANPGMRVLLLVVELCALWFRRDDFSKSNIVATALFSDGAAAAILGTEGDGPAIVASGEYTFAQTLDVMGWDVENEGMKAIFSRDIPALVEKEFGGVVDGFLALHDLSRAGVTQLLAHPGGAKVVEALEHVFELPPGSLVDSREILRNYGNMSAATVMFVIERAMRRGALARGRCGHTLVSAMGPGFTAAFTLIEYP